MGFWIIEDIVDTATEPYAQGALDQLVHVFSGDFGGNANSDMMNLDSWPHHAKGRWSLCCPRSACNARGQLK
jgi:hypothetical protein